MWHLGLEPETTSFVCMLILLWRRRRSKDIGFFESGEPSFFCRPFFPALMGIIETHGVRASGKVPGAMVQSNGPLSGCSF